MKRKNSHGFSMVEALVAAIILSIGVIGVFATMSSQKKPAVESDARVLAALAGKQYLEELRSKVDATNFDVGGPFELRTYGPVSVGIYQMTYTVTQPAGSNARRVDLTVTWP